MIRFLLENHIPVIDYLTTTELRSLACLGDRHAMVPRDAWRKALVQDLQLADTRSLRRSITLVHDAQHVTSCDRQLVSGADDTTLYRRIGLSMFPTPRDWRKSIDRACSDTGE